MIENRLKRAKLKSMTEKKGQKTDGKGTKHQEKREWQSDGKNKDGGRAGLEKGVRKTGKAEQRGMGKTEQRNMGKAEQRNVGKPEQHSTGKPGQRSVVKPEQRRGNSGAEGAARQNEIRETKKSQCPVSSRCGGCQFIDMPYKKQLEIKQKQLDELLKPFCHVNPIIGMENPYNYRNKVHAVFDHDRKGNPVSGVYEANTHRVVPVESCLIEDPKADEIIGTIRGMLKSFKIRTYDEDTGYGLLRHVLIRRGFVTGEIMVVLVTADPVFPSKTNFVRALREKHPEITTVIQNINGKNTNMVLGEKEHILFGKGYIEDILCGCRFRISSKSFYQVNPAQTDILYRKAIEAAGLTGKEKVIDAYCGIGTIGIVASQSAGQVIGVELNRDAVRDAVENAKLNGVKNIQFYCNDAGAFMVNMAEQGEKVDVVFMDPPRSGSTEEFIDSVAKMRPEKVVYVSCGPETLARDLEMFQKKGFRVKEAWGIDLFPQTLHVESVVLMSRKDK